MEPVAINVFSALSVAMELSEAVMNREDDPPESEKAAWPWT